MTFKYIIGICILGFTMAKAATEYPFNNATLPASQRAADLISRLTTDEKISQLGHKAPPIPRLNIPQYTYWNEACHGVVEIDVTVFPQTIGLSATWDTTLIYSIADAISSEARVLNRLRRIDLNFFAPTINMARDPRWGRNEETYGEDVFLAKKMSVNFIRGMQGNNPRYLKTAATAKHFACNNVDITRRYNSSDVNERALREYYFPVFKAAVDAGVASVMSAYNALNGIPCSANKWLITDLLKKEWGFKGFVVSDCDAINFLNSEHHFVTTNAQAAALACQAGCDLECGSIYQQYLHVALATNTLGFSEASIDSALIRVLTSRFLLGEFDPPSLVPYASIPSSECNSQKHHDLSLRAARLSVVLLKNDSLLPLDTSKISSIAVIGPFANFCNLGGYSGVPSESVTPLRGIKEFFGASKGKKVAYARGCSATGPFDPSEFDRAIDAAVNSDVAIIFAGTGHECAREEFDFAFTGLPGVQQQLVDAVFSANPKTIVVLINGNPLPIIWVKKRIPAIVEAWYGGPYQGRAIADVLFGNYNPGGKLTQTWVNYGRDLPDFNDYDIFNNRTYMFYEGDPLFPFGYGLSYTSFSYSNIQITPLTFNKTDTVSVNADITNTGAREGDEVVQLYIRDENSSVKVAAKQLKGFVRLSLLPGETKTAMFRIPYDEFSFWDTTKHAFTVEPGSFDVMIGTSSAEILLSGEVTALSDVPKPSGKPTFKNTGLFKQGNNAYSFSFSTPTSHSIEIIGLDGRVVYKRNQIGVAEYRLPPMPSGIYIAKVADGAERQSIKMLITR